MGAGLFPLVAGVLIFCTWYFTRWAVLEAAGMANILIGLLIVAIGFVCLIVYFLSTDAPGWGRRAWWAVLILLANFPVAAGLIYASIYFKSEYILTVENRSPWALDKLAITSQGRRHVFAGVASGSSEKLKFRVAHDGSISFVASLNGKPLQGVVEEYVTPAFGGKATLFVSDHGEVRVIRDR